MYITFYGQSSYTVDVVELASWDFIHLIVPVANKTMKASGMQYCE